MTKLQMRTKTGNMLTLEVHNAKSEPMDVLQWDCLLRRWKMRQKYFRKA